MGFTPLSLSPAVWLKADTLALADGDPVGTWADQSGNGRDLVQATSAAKPMFKTAVLNGRPAVLFDGVDDVVEYVGGSDWVTGTGLTVFAVVKRVSATYSAGTSAFKSNAGGADYDNVQSCIVGYQGGGGGNLQGYRNGALSDAFHPGDGVAFQECSQWDGTNHTTYKNGVGATPVASSGSFAIRMCRLGKRYTPEVHNAYYFEWIVYDRSLNSTERGDVITYLTGRWGV